MSDLRERLAAIEHERWAHWQRWMHGVCIRTRCPACGFTGIHPSHE